MQIRMHLQVFSTAPADEAMNALKDRLPVIMKQAGVSGLVSVWDEAKLAKYPETSWIDVTDLILREFNVPDRQRNLFAGIEKTKLLALDEARELDASGKMWAVASALCCFVLLTHPPAKEQRYLGEIGSGSCMMSRGRITGHRPVASAT